MLFDRWHDLGSPSFHVRVFPVLSFLLEHGNVFIMVVDLHFYIGLIEIWPRKFFELIKCLPFFLVHRFRERHSLCSGHLNQLIVDLRVIVDRMLREFHHVFAGGALDRELSRFQIAEPSRRRIPYESCVWYGFPLPFFLGPKEGTRPDVRFSSPNERTALTNALTSSLGGYTLETSNPREG